MTRASDTARLLGAGGSILGSLDVGGGQIGGRRNIVINGAMNVAQRSTSVTGIGATTGYFTCDRWQIAENDASAGRLTMTQTADGPNGISANCLKLDCTTADTSIAAGEVLQVLQKFEGQDLQSIGKGITGAKEITVSFYVKASAAFDFVCELYDLDNGRQISKLFSTTTDWVRHEFTFPADVDDGSSPFGDDNAASLQLSFWLHGGSTFTSGTLNTASWANATNANRAAGIDSFFSSTDNNFFLTGVQMEVGSVATPFESRSFGEELALCQRYFHKSENSASAYKRYAVMHVETTTNTRSKYPLPVPMRTHPSLTSSGTLAIYNHVGGIINLSSISLNPTFAQADGLGFRDVCIYAVVSSGLTAGTIGSLLSNNAVASLQFDAEL